MIIATSKSVDQIVNERLANETLSQRIGRLQNITKDEPGLLGHRSLPMIDELYKDWGEKQVSIDVYLYVGNFPEEVVVSNHKKKTNGQYQIIVSPDNLIAREEVSSWNQSKWWTRLCYSDAAYDYGTRKEDLRFEIAKCFLRSLLANPQKATSYKEITLLVSDAEVYVGSEVNIFRGGKTTKPNFAPYYEAKIKPFLLELGYESKNE
jgi:hypothetical protein